VSVRPFVAPARARRGRRPVRLWTAVGTALLSVLTLFPVVAAPALASSQDAASVASTTTGATSGFLEGIDVSHWQNTIDWTKVRAAGKAFAIIKASQGQFYVDPLYATNHAGAQAAGLWTGAYHFAEPDGTANDAILEADHFAASIRLGRGDLIPALDLEQSGGLTVAGLQSWVTTWLAEVTRKVGIRPMIYTSPAFWQKYMGDSRALADAGYKTLWIAHWGVSSPTVPASNWGGRGWTFWQYSNCGTVPGISGCVDLDRYNGTDLLPQAFSMFSLSAASSGQVKQARTNAAAATIGISRTNFPMEVALTVSGLPSGAIAGFNVSPTTQTSSALIVTTTPSVAIGSYPLTITGTGNGLTRKASVSLVIVDGVPPTLVAPSMWLEAGSTVGPTNVPVMTRWSGTDPSGIASFALQRSIDGGTSWSTAIGSTLATSAWQAIPTGSHAVSRLRGTDKLGNMSGWLPGPAATVLMTNQVGRAVTYRGTWRTLTTSSALGGTLAYASVAGTSVSYAFSGSSVGWIATLGPNRGYAKVYVDGVYLKTVSLYSATYRYRRVVWTRNWTTTSTHTLTIVVLGTAGHPVVDVDGFTVLQRG
jgi:GH25 family lysozyme M1 (1,4-beta-N-acetylmuramidase)